MEQRCENQKVGSEGLPWQVSEGVGGEGDERDGWSYSDRYVNQMTLADAGYR